MHRCPIAVSEDTGGSTRVPALYNGIFGFDPCRNHYPNEGNPGMTYTRDQIGVLARTMADILIYDRAVGGTYTYTCTLADILIYDRAVGGTYTYVS